jgi:hypothetical protein
MPKPQLLKIAALATLIAAALLHAGSAWVSTPCADYGIGIGAGPDYYDVTWIKGNIAALKEYSDFRCRGSQISDGYAWFFANNYAGRMVNWKCIEVNTEIILRAPSETNPWFMIRSGFFGPFLAKYDAWGNYHYLGYCQEDNVVYSYSITGWMQWP